MPRLGHFSDERQRGFGGGKTSGESGERGECCLYRHVKPPEFLLEIRLDDRLLAERVDSP